MRFGFRPRVEAFQHFVYDILTASTSVRGPSNIYVCMLLLLGTYNSKPVLERINSRAKFQTHFRIL